MALNLVNVFSSNHFVFFLVFKALYIVHYASDSQNPVQFRANSRTFFASLSFIPSQLQPGLDGGSKFRVKHSHPSTL